MQNFSRSKQIYFVLNQEQRKDLLNFALEDELVYLIGAMGLKTMD